MSLRDRFRSVNSRPDKAEHEDKSGKGTPSAVAGDGNGKGNGKSVANALNDRTSGLKARIHRRMVERINLANLDSIAPEMLRAQIGHIINTLVTEEGIPLSESQRLALEQEVMNETFGLGPIEPLLHDPDIGAVPVIRPVGADPPDPEFMLERQYIRALVHLVRVEQGPVNVEEDQSPFLSVIFHDESRPPVRRGSGPGR